MVRDTSSIENDEVKLPIGGENKGDGETEIKETNDYQQLSQIKQKSSNEMRLLKNNFDKTLLRLFKEVHFWDRLPGDFAIPYAATDIATGEKRKKLISLREHVMLVVRDYNKILQALDIDERKLFQGNNPSPNIRPFS